MNAIKKGQNVLLAISSIVLMIGGGLLLYQTLNVYYNTSSALLVVSLSILSVFLYVAGASLMGRMKKNGIQQYWNGVSSSIVFALVLVAAGMLLLGFNTACLPPVWKGFFFSWPMLLLIIGVGHICKFQFLWGIILAAVGKFFLFAKASAMFPGNAFYEEFSSTYWPVLIIVCGVLILLSTVICSGKCSNKCNKGKWRENHTSNEGENNDGKINYRLTFSGTEQVILDPVFRGGDIDITFGGMELDLRRTSLAEGETFLYINVVFGGVEITAPDNWDIDLRQNRFAAGIEDSRVKGMEKDRTRKLIIIAKCSFGGIDIK